MKRSRLHFRADIEGLRAIAILLVVAAHARVPGLQGGFVGVDVFFVLSGYLITALLVEELDAEGRLDLAGFYARRCKRLLPGLLAMLVATGLAAAVLLPKAEQAEQAAAGTSAALWLSNIYYAFTKLDYFAAGTESSLYLHTWSLGVEEQFYLLWPLLPLLLLGRRHPAAAFGRGRLIRAMGVIAALSLLAEWVLTPRQAPLAFYLMPLRAWEFAWGALAWLSGGIGRARWRAIAGWAGLGLILAAAWIYGPDAPYPGWRAMLPALGAAALLKAGVGADADRDGPWRLLAVRPLQLVGRVSYAWYLWHWPVLVLGAVAWDASGLPVRMGLACSSLLLAMLAYYLLEAPIRRLTPRPPAALMAAGVAICAVVLLGLRWKTFAAEQLQRPDQARLLAIRGDLPAIYAMGCDDWFHSDTLKPCRFGPERPRHTVVLLGDSIGAQWFPAVSEAFSRAGWQLIVLTKSSCPMVERPLFYPRIGREYIECERWRRHAVAYAAALKPDVAILGSAATYAYTASDWKDGTRALLAALSPAAGRVYLLRGTPALPFDGPRCLYVGGACRAPAFDARNEEIYTNLRAAAAGYANTSVLDMNDAVCPAGECRAELDGKVVFRDTQHLTASFAAYLGGEFAKRVARDAPLAASGASASLQ